MIISFDEVRIGDCFMDYAGRQYLVLDKGRVHVVRMDAHGHTSLSQRSNWDHFGRHLIDFDARDIAFK